MKKSLSILLLAIIVIFMACGGANKKDIKKAILDSIRKADSIAKINDSIIKVKVVKAKKKKELLTV